MILILNKEEQIIAELNNDGSGACPYKYDLHHEKLNDAYQTYVFSVPTDHVDSVHVQKNNRVVIQDPDGNFLLFIIQKTEEVKGQTEKLKKATCVSGHLELLGTIVRPAELLAVTIEQALYSFLQETRWDIGVMEWSGVKDIVIKDYLTAIQAIHLLRDEFGAELVFRVEFTGPKITKRYLDFYQKRGTNRGKVIEYGKDITSIVKKESIETVYTALIGVGKADKDGKLLTFASVDAPDKPVGQDWIGNEEAREQFGIDGRHYMGYYVYSGADDITAAELLAKTRLKLEEVSKPFYSYEVKNVDLSRILGLEHEVLRIGDTDYVKDYESEPYLLLETRILEMKRSQSDPSRDECVLGEFRQLPTDIYDELEKIQQTLLKKQQSWEESGTKVVRSDTAPSDITAVWVDTSRTEVPFDLPKTFNTVMGQWETAAPTVAGQIGAETPEEAARKASTAEQNAKDYTDNQLVGFVDAVTYDQDISSIQNQIDGNISSYFKAYNPTLSNVPASEWTTNSMKDVHLGDLFYNTTNGYAWRFAYESSAYKWIEVKDTDVQKALADAAKAQDTADSKRRTFVVQPIPPYDVGDMWKQGQTAYVATVAKATGGVFSASDWELVGDVTSQNTSADTAKVGGTPASDMETKTGSQAKADTSEANAKFYSKVTSGVNLVKGLYDLTLPSGYEWRVTTLADGSEGRAIYKKHTGGQSVQNLPLHLAKIKVNPKKAYLMECEVKAMDTNSRYYLGREEYTAAGADNDAGNGPYGIGGRIPLSTDVGVWRKHYFLIPSHDAGVEGSHTTAQSSMTPDAEHKFWNANTAQIMPKIYLTYGPLNSALNSEMYMSNIRVFEVGSDDALYDYASDASNLNKGIINVDAVTLHTAPNGARITFDGVNGIVQYDANGNVVVQLGLDGSAKFAGDISGAKGTFTGALSTLLDISVGRYINLTAAAGVGRTINFGGNGKIHYFDDIDFLQLGDRVVGGVDDGKAPEVWVPGQLTISKDIVMEQGKAETGYCGVGGVDHNTTNPIAGVGVGFKAVKSVAPSSVTLTPESGSTSNVSAIAITKYGFWLYIWGANTTVYRYFRGNYTA
jgi:phage minor structural protein